MKLSFLGAVGTVTGSKYLIESNNKRILIDCGLFQGFKQLRLRNWAPLPIPPGTIDAVILTHAHIDHSGYLPLLVKNGFRGPVYCTPPTRDLCKLLLLDSAYLQEKDAESANRYHYSKHHPALPLYTVKDAKKALEHLIPKSFDTSHDLLDFTQIEFLHAGHILGAAIVKITKGKCSIVFSGDLGRFNDATMLEPMIVKGADYLVVESTYGDREHEKKDIQQTLCDIINRTSKRGGTLVIPTFAVGRTQSLLYHLKCIKEKKLIPDIPIFLDSPMAIDASDMFVNYLSDQKLSANEWYQACAVARYVPGSEDSKALDENLMPKIIISASGMATGGRVLHHIKRYASDERNTILFSGYQAGGTRGAAMVAGAKVVKIHGGYVPIHAEVEKIDMLSSHADSGEIMNWLRHFTSAPDMTFITHGEPAAADALRLRISEELAWPCRVPEYLEGYELQ